MNLYGFMGNDGIDSWDYLGFEPQPKPEKKIEECTIFIILGHGGDVDKWIKDKLGEVAPKTCRFGPLGCYTDPVPKGYEIDDFPDTSKCYFGIGELAQGQDGNCGKSPNDGATRSDRKKGFAAVLVAALDSATKEAKSVCLESKDKKPCCKEVKIVFDMITTVDGKDAELQDALSFTELGGDWQSPGTFTWVPKPEDEKWKDGKTWTVPCE